MLKLNSGLSKNLPSENTSGYLYFTTDTQELYADINENLRIRIRDIIPVAREIDLPTLTAEDNNKFYYVKETGQLVIYDSESKKFKPVNSLESFGITLTPEEINQLKTSIDDIINKIDGGEIGGGGEGVNFLYNSTGSNLVGITGGTPNWVDFKRVKEGRLNQLSDIPLLDPGLNNVNTKDFTLNDLNNYSTELVFLDRFSNGTIVEIPEDDPRFTTIPTKYLTSWLKYAIGNDIKNNKIDIGTVGDGINLKRSEFGNNYNNLANSEPTKEGRILDFGNMKAGKIFQNSDLVEKGFVINDDTALSDLNKISTELLFLNRGSTGTITGEATEDPEMVAVSIDAFTDWLKRALMNDSEIGAGSGSGGDTTIITNGVKVYTKFTELDSAFENDTPLEAVITEMEIPSELFISVKANGDYPEDGVLRITKTADKTASVTLIGEDFYFLSIDPENWDEIFGEELPPTVIEKVPTQKGILVYNRLEQEPQWNDFNPLAMTIGGRTKATDNGIYTATFTPRYGYVWFDGTKDPKSAKWEIKRESVVIDAVPSQRGELVYNGQLQTPEWNDFDEEVLSISGQINGTNAGEYEAIFTPKGECVWSDGTNDSKRVKWTIKGQTINDVPSFTGTLTYNGNSQSPTWVNYDTEKMTLTGDSSGINAGTYNAVFTPKENYQWADGTFEGKTITWTINKAVISTAPVQNGTLTYTGSAQTPTWLNYDANKLTIGGTTSGTNAGSYNATFTPKANYQWADNSTTAKTVSWKINKAAGTLSISPTTLTIEKGKTATITVTRSGNGTIQATSSNPSVATVTVTSS